MVRLPELLAAPGNHEIKVPRRGDLSVVESACRNAHIPGGGLFFRPLLAALGILAVTASEVSLQQKATLRN